MTIAERVAQAKSKIENLDPAPQVGYPLASQLKQCRSGGTTQAVARALIAE